MSKLLSEVLFNRALIWLVMAELVNDNERLSGWYIVLAILDVVMSLKARVGEDA